MKKNILMSLILSLFVTFSCTTPEVVNEKEGVNGKNDNTNETEKKLIGVWNTVRMYREVNGKKTEIDIKNIPNKGYFSKTARIKYDGKVSTITKISYKDGKKESEFNFSHFYRVSKNIITYDKSESHFFIEKDLLHIAIDIHNENSIIKYKYIVLEKQK